MEAIINYIKDHILLTVVLAIVLVLIIVFVILLAVDLSRKKKNAKTKPALQPSEEPAAVPPCAPETAPAEEKAEEPAPAPEPMPETPPQAPPAEEEKEPEPIQTETPGYVFVPVKKDRPADKKPAQAEKQKEETVKQEKKTDKKPAQTAKPVAPAAKPAAPAAKPVAPAAKPAKKESVGKWVVENVKGKYWLSLIAPNGQVMLESPTAYASLSGAKSGVKTYQDNIAAGRLEITEHKNGDSQVQVLNGRGGLLATSSTYSSRSQAESALASIKRWAATAVIVESDESDKK